MLNLYLEKAKKSAYFLWEYTENDNALNHWFCAEDVACFFEISGICKLEGLDEIKRKGKYDQSYVEFVRHLAFRIYVYTKNENSVCNWYIAEKLLKNVEWCEAICTMSNIYSQEKDKSSFISNIRSEKVRSYYNGTAKYYR